MLTLGKKIDISSFAPVKLVNVSEAQAYLHPIAQAIYAEIKMPAYLVDDGENQTSDLLVDAAEDLFAKTGNLSGSTLFKIIEHLAKRGNAIIIWWANNNVFAYQGAHKCNSLEMLFEFATEQVRSNRAIQVFLPPNQSFNTDWRDKTAPAG